MDADSVDSNHLNSKKIYIMSLSLLINKYLIFKYNFLYEGISEAYSTFIDFHVAFIALRPTGFTSSLVWLR